MKVNTSLWKHQQELHNFAVERIDAQPLVKVRDWEDVVIDNGFAWWLAGCATGKTLASFKLIETTQAKQTLVLTTKAAMTTTWGYEAKKHTEGLKVFLPSGSVKDKAKQLLALPRDETTVFVVNYASARGMDRAIADFGFDLVISDESHKLKSYNSMTSKNLARACADIPYKLAMTGTGFDDRPTDIFGQVRWLDPIMKRGRVHSRILGTWTSFFDRYVQYIRYDNIPIVKGYKNQDEMREWINPFTYYLDSEQVLDLPDELHMEREVPMPRPIKQAYDDMKQHFVAELNNGELLVADSAIEKAMRLHQITSGYLPDNTGRATPIVEPKKNPKLQETLAIMDELGDAPIVIFTRFVQDVKLLRETLTEMGYSVKQLTGEKQEHGEWIDGEGQVLIANIQAGNAGIDLTRSRYVIYYSIGHSRTDYNQSLYRVRRPNADLHHPVTYWHIIMENSIDVDIRKAMTSKEDSAQFIIEGLRR